MFVIILRPTNKSAGDALNVAREILNISDF